MPLLHGKPFIPSKPPQDLNPDEEVFVYPPTNEVFRSYDDYFNRHYICNTTNWACELTGQQNLTYEQAIESEREAQASLYLLTDTLKHSILSSLQFPLNANMKILVDTITSFYKERFVLGEELDYFPSSEDKKSSKKVKVISVNKPLVSTSPVKPDAHQLSLSHHDAPASISDASLSDITSTSTPVTSSNKTSKHFIGLDMETQPSCYEYKVQDLANLSINYTATFEQLSRPKHCLTKEKLKLFLKNALHRDTEKHTLQIKPEYVTKYQLKVPPASIASIIHHSSSPSNAISTTFATPQKRSLSQSSLDSFFLTPNDPKKPKMALSMLSSSNSKKSSKSPRKSIKTPRRKSKTSLTSNSKTPKNKDSSTAKTPTSIGAKKVLKKAKQLKQLDLRKSLVKKKGGELLSEEELLALKAQSSSKRKRRESEQERLKLEKLNRKKEQRERKKLAKLKELENLKPREDTLCEDSKPLPLFDPVVTILPPDLFGDAVMMLEFLHHYGPLFNLKESIHTTITFGKLEEALVSNHPDTILYGVIKSLLQTIFATMEEEHEAVVELDKKKRSSVERNEQEDEGQIETTSRTESRRSSVGSIPVEGIEEVEERSRDDRLASLKISAATYSKWPHMTQATSLFQLAFDPYTCTEIVRLHLLSSGGYSSEGERTWFRFCSRGGFVDSDDPVLEFRLNHSQVIDALSSTSLYDLSPSHKLKLLSVLSLQMLMFSVSREFLDENLEEGKKIRKEIRQLQFSLSEKKKKVTKDESKREGTPPPSEGATQNGKKEKGHNMGVEETTEEKSETKEERKVRVNEEIRKLETRLYPVNASINLQPLGYDRYNNKYWLFPSIPGLFVELSEQQIGLATNTRETEGKDKGLSAEEKVKERSVEVVDCVDSTPASDSFKENCPVCEPTITKDQPQVTNELLNKSQSLIPLETLPPVIKSSSVEVGDNTEITNGAITKPTATNTVKFNRSMSPIIKLSKVNTSCDATTVKDRSLSDRISPVEAPPIHYISSKQISDWGIYSNKERIEILVGSLNIRGLREVKLKGSLEKIFPLFDDVSKCPVAEAYTSKDWSTTPLESTADEYLELYLREQLLDLEEKIWMGNLGSVKDVKDRMRWRDSIESSGAAGKISGDPDMVNGHSVSGSSDSVSSTLSPVNELAKNLLDIQEWIEKKYLLPPLGTGVDLKMKGKDAKKNGLVKKDAICLDEWRSSLLKTTSFSQIFVHLSTLERSVAWSKSLMNVRCRICRRKGGDEYMLLCDGCDHGYHTYCLRPPVTDIPEGDWFCYNCCPVTPMKRRRTVVCMKELSESESESERDEEYKEEEVEEEEEEEEEMEEELVEEVVGRRSLRHSTVVQRASTRSRVTRNTRHSKHCSPPPLVEETKRRPGRKRKDESVIQSRVKKKLKMDDSSSNASSGGSYIDKAESIISSIIDVRCSKVQGPAQRKAQQTLEHQLSKALLEELMSHDDSWPFLNAVRRRECPDYHEIVNQPMDFKTIRQKVSSHKYNNLDQFLGDINLIFSNCFLYYKRQTKEGRAGSSLKKFLDHRYADLGLRNLTGSNSNCSTGIQLRSLSTSSH